MKDLEEPPCTLYPPVSRANEHLVATTVVPKLTDMPMPPALGSVTLSGRYQARSRRTSRRTSRFQVSTILPKVFYKPKISQK